MGGNHWSDNDYNKNGGGNGKRRGGRHGERGDRKRAKVDLSWLVYDRDGLSPIPKLDLGSLYKTYITVRKTCTWFRYNFGHHFHYS